MLDSNIQVLRPFSSRIWTAASAWGRHVIWQAGPWLTAQRACAWCIVLLGAELVTLLIVAAATHGLITHGMGPSTTDFSSFYAAGHLAANGHPALAYDQAAHYAQEQRDTSPGVIYSYFYYPPIFMLICTILAHFPYLVAFMVFQISSLALYVSAALRIMARQTWLAAIAVLAFPPNFWNFGLGQNGFLTAGLFGYATFLTDRRPLLAGVLFGGISIKPHFGLLIPVALIAGRHWRAFMAAAATVIALALLSTLCFGVDTWRAFFASFTGSPSMYQSGEIAFQLMISVFAAMRMEGASPVAAYVVQAVATLTCMGLVAIVWSRGLSLPVRSATLMAATVVSVPLILFYDLTLIGIALAWLARAEGRPLSNLEKILFGIVFALGLSVRTLTWVLALPVGLLAALIVLAMAVWRGRLETVPGSRPQTFYLAQAAR